MKEGKKEIHVYRKYFITKRNQGGSEDNQFTETVWDLDVDKDLLFRMRVQSPNTNFKIALTTADGAVLADAPSVVGYGASISSVISKDKLNPGNSKVQIKFHFYDFLKTPEEIIEHEDVHDCHLPHIVLEMSIMEKEEFKARKDKYTQNLPSNAEVRFPAIEQSQIGYSGDNEQSAKMSNSDNYYDLTKTDSDSKGKFQILKEYHFTIDSEDERQKNKEAAQLLYYLQLQLTADFMTSGSMHVVVVHEKDESDPMVQKENLFAYDTLNCAEEMVCVVSHRTAKNEESLHIALTEGSYGIYFVDYQNEGIRNYIADTVKKIPFSSVIYLYPVEAQDNSVYCDGLSIPDPYFVPYVITEKAIFDQKIEVNLRNATQDLYFNIDTEETTYVRVTTEQDIGMDVDIKIFDSSNTELARGKDIGATETAVAKVPIKGRIKVQLSYRNSIIRDLTSCPQVHLYLSALSESKVKEIGKKQSEVMGQDTSSYKKIEEVIGKMQDAIDNGESYTNKDQFDYIYVFDRESYTNMEENIYQNKLTLKKDKPYWVYIEIFCDQVINDVVVDMDFGDRRFSKTSDVEQKLIAGKTDQILRSQKALHVFSMVMSYRDDYNIQFLSRNMLEKVTGFEDQLKHVMFQMKVQLKPLGPSQTIPTMTSLLPPTFNNLRDLGMPTMKYEDVRFFRERIFLSAKSKNKITMDVVKNSRMRVYLKSLVSGVNINDVYVTDSSDSKLTGIIIERNFIESDMSFKLPGSGRFTLVIETLAKKRKYGDFMMKIEIDPEITRTQCKNEKLPSFDNIAIKAKRSDTTQETHYYVGNAMFRNIYHLGQKQVGSPTDFYSVNLPTSNGKNYAVIPFTLDKYRNLVTVNLFHNWVDDLVKLYILPQKEDPQDLFDLIRDQKKADDHNNVAREDQIPQSKTLEFFEGIEKVALKKGKYNIVIMNMDPSTDNGKKVCMDFAMSIYVEEQLKRSESKDKSGIQVTSYDQISDSLDETVIESMSLCQATFMFNEMFKNPLKVNGGVLSIDSVYRFDNDERKKQIEFEVDTNSVIFVKVTDIMYATMPTLEMSLKVLKPKKNQPYDEVAKVVTSKRAEKSDITGSEKHVEIQEFVRKGKYALDLSNSVFDVDTELFPCNRIRVEIEIRPLKDIPDILKDEETCSANKNTKLPVPFDPEAYNKLVRTDEYYPITSNVLKKFKVRVTEPSFLVFFANFEKEISGGTMSISITHIPNRKANEISNDPKTKGSLPVYFSTDSYDGVAFAHERLEPYLSGHILTSLKYSDMKLDAPGEYLIILKGHSKANLTKSLQQNKYIPRCSKVSMHYKLTKLSDMENTLDEEYLAEKGTVDSSSNNCKNVDIDSPRAVQKELDASRSREYMDINAKVLIPEPSSRKKMTFRLSSTSKPITSVIKVTAALPDEIREISDMKFSLNVAPAKMKESDDETDIEFLQAPTQNSQVQDAAFLLDDTKNVNYIVTIEFDEVDFSLLQNHCSFLELRFAREPKSIALLALKSFVLTKSYKDVATLKENPKTVTIDKEKAKNFHLYRTKSNIMGKSRSLLGKISIEIKSDQAQLDITAEYNYITTQISLMLTGEDQFSDHGTFEVDDSHFATNQLFTGRNAIRLIGTGKMLPKGTYTLYIYADKFTKKLLQSYENEQLSDDLLVPFNIRIDGTPVGEDLKVENEQLRLIDLEYNGNPDDDGKEINVDQDLSVTFEFNEDLDDSKLTLTDTDNSFVTLNLSKEFHKGTKRSERKVTPSVIEKPSTLSQNTIQVVFPVNSLKKNAKYTLQLDSRIGINPELQELDAFTIQTLSTD